MAQSQEGSKKGLKHKQTIADTINARDKWICAEEFDPKPLNISGLARVELARDKETGTQFLAIFDEETGTFTNKDTCEEYTAGALEIRVNELL
jgi:hypothetical protein